ncbi:MAG: nucleotidyltransferase family protein [Armatimonadetes bacterium]|nr:nucleotidyltransferase family protein [Armatimonadota bacterium]
MNALILAAGYATRLYPLTRDQPKPLLPVGGRPILDYLLDDLETLPELRQVYVVTNHRFAPRFQAWAAARGTHPPLQVLDDGTHTPDDRLGAIGDLAWAIRHAGIEGPLLVAAADNLLPFRLQEMVRFARERGTDCLTCYHLEDPERLRRTGILARDAAGRVTRFEEKPPRPWSHLAVPPIYYYLSETLPLFAQYLAEGNNPDAPGGFVPWLLARRPVHAFLFEGQPLDIGNLQSYREACARMDGRLGG